MSSLFALRSPLTPLAGLAVTLGLVGCGGATPAAQTPVEVAVVEVGGAQAASGAPKAEEGKMGAADKKEIDRDAARKEALEEAEEYGVIGLLNPGAATGVFDSLMSGVSGGVVGGVLGGSSGGSGIGGFGVRGSGAGGGGSGVGLGSIGTIGRGSGGGTYGAGSGFSGNPVEGQAVHVSGNTVIALGDSVTLGVTVEVATRMLRGRVAPMRACYIKAQERDRLVEGSVALRLVIGKDGRVVLARDLGSDLPDREAIACVIGAMKDVYVGFVGSTFFGVIETTIRFSPKK